MWLIVVALAAGVAVGAVRRLPAAWTAHSCRVMNITLFIMLAALGAQIGANRELLVNLPSLGWRAAVISALSIAGSVVALRLTAKYLEPSAGPGGEG